MLKMSQVNYIRDLSNSGYRIAEISKKLKLDRKTVRKYPNQEDFSPTPPVRHPGALEAGPLQAEDPRMSGRGPACLAEAAAHGQAASRPSPRGGRL